jgi:hypothetical protein
MNLEVDVMEGDEFTEVDGDVLQYRDNEFRRISFRRIGKLWCDKSPFDNEHAIDIPTFIRYCDGCGLTVKMVKPERKIETIEPLEWACVYHDGLVLPCITQRAAEAVAGTWPGGVVRRIDWGAK